MASLNFSADEKELDWWCRSCGSVSNGKGNKGIPNLVHAAQKLVSPETLYQVKKGEGPSLSEFTQALAEIHACLNKPRPVVA